MAKNTVSKEYEIKSFNSHKKKLKGLQNRNIEVPFI